MSEEFSIDRSRGGQARGPNDPLRVSGGNPGVTEWDLGSGAAAEPQAPQAGPERESTRPEATSAEPPAAPLPPFRDLIDEEDEERSTLPGIDIRRLLLGCWRRRTMVGGIAIAVTLAFGTMAFSLIENQWTAVTTLIKRDSSDEFSIGGSKPFKPQQYNLQTLLDTLKLPSSLDEVIERADLDLKRTALSAAIDVRLGKESDIMHLLVNWADPQTAALVANHLADVFLERSSAMRRSDAEETHHYYRQRLQETRAERRRIDAELLAFQQKNNLSNFDAETEARLGELARLEGEYQTQAAEIEALRFAIERLEQEIAGQPDMIIRSTIYRSPLKQRLADYEWELQEARSRYTPDNPKVAKLQKKVDVLSRMITESNDQAVPENTYSPNDHRLDLNMRLHELRDDLKMREGRIGALQDTIAEMKQKLAFLSSMEKEFVRLKLRQEASESLEFSLTHRVDEARVQMLRSEPAFDVVERATPPEERQPSGRKLVVVGGAIVGSGLGLLIALLLEFFDPRVRTRRDGSDLSGSEVCSEWQRLPAAVRQRVTAERMVSPTVMTFRHFVNNLQAQYGEEQLHSIAVISAERGAGRSLVAANLARTLALKEHATLLVDADTGSEAGRRPQQLCDAASSDNGLLQILDGTTTLRAALVKTDIPKLHCLGPGQARNKQTAPLALGGKRMAKFITALRQFGGHVVYDLPPLQGHETALEAAAVIGNAVLVLRSGWSRRDQVRKLVQLLQKRHVNILGTLVIDVEDHYREEKSDPASRADAGARTIDEENHDVPPHALQNA